MKIILVHKAEFPKRPPVINSTLILSELGHDVTLITEGLNEYWTEELKRRNIKVHVIEKKFAKYKTLGKVLAYHHFRKRTFSIVEEEKKRHSSVLIWVEGAYTIETERLSPHIADTGTARGIKNAVEGDIKGYQHCRGCIYAGIQPRSHI